MGREVRKVPANWEHPKNEDGHHIPIFGKSIQGALKEFAENPSWYDNEDGKGPQEPRAEDYMPEWPESEKTHFQMYESTTEGTPISLPMETPEKLARWLADTGASAFACKTATYEEWLATIRRGCAVSMMISQETGVISGVAAEKFLEGNSHDALLEAATRLAREVPCYCDRDREKPDFKPCGCCDLAKVIAQAEGRTQKEPYEKPGSRAGMPEKKEGE